MTLRHATRTLLAAIALSTALIATGPVTAHAITGGTAVSGSDLAFVAEVNDIGGGFCTGALIHSSWVLTAAHCSDPFFVGNLSVRVGNNTRGTGGELRRVSRILRHREYAGGHNDVALLELSEPVTTIKPVRLAAPSEGYLWDGTQGGQLSAYDQGIAVGWGQTATTTRPSQLQFVGVNIKPSYYESGLKVVPVDKGPCPGDSGGPLLVTVNGAYAVAGVVKRSACGDEATYSEVGAGGNRDWLISMLTKLPYAAFGAADWDRDGHQDVLARHEASGDLWLYPGRSVPYNSGIPGSRIGTGFRGYTPFGVTDWDRDGYQDLIARQDSTGELWLYPGQGQRHPSTAARVKLADGWGGHSPVGAADWDRDGSADLLTRRETTRQLLLFPGPGVRGALSGASFTLAYDWHKVSAFGVTDWNRDGHQDVIARDNDSANLFVYPGAGQRGLLSAGRSLIGNGWAGYSAFGVPDWDRDGHRDILARSDYTGDMWLYSGRSVLYDAGVPRAWLGGGW